MKKTISTFIVVALLFGGTSFTFAETPTTASTATLIAQLQAQIADLLAKVTAMKKAQTDLVSSQQDVNSTLMLIGNLKEGMTSEQVMLLQTVLASDASIYPEGKITGYYGKLTTKAIKRFQKLHGLHGDGTNTSSSTKKIINEILRNAPLSRENKEHGKKDSGQLCITTPPGHLIAPGWLKNKGNYQNI